MLPRFKDQTQVVVPETAATTPQKKKKKKFGDVGAQRSKPKLRKC